MGLDKSFVYRCIDRYNVYLDTHKDIYLSNDVSVRTIQLVKKIDDIPTKIEIADKIKDKEISSSKSLQEYLVSRVRQDIQEISYKRITKSNFQLTKTNRQISIKLKGEFSPDEFLEISSLIETFIAKHTHF
jgi:hypothetical protein